MIRRLLLPIMLMLLSPPAWCMQFGLVGQTLVMSGPVLGDDLARLKDHLAAGQVKLVLLHESPGGDLWNGIQLAHLIRDAGLPTAVSGKCQSSCGMIFLGGVERSFTDGRPLGETLVGLHGAHDPNTKLAMPEVGARMAWLISSWTGERFPSALLQRTVYPNDPRDFVFVFHPRRFRPPARQQGVMECLINAQDKYDCKMVDAMDGLSTGVVTNPDIMVLDAAVKEYLGRQQEGRKE
jgi:hypothetical protein